MSKTSLSLDSGGRVPLTFSRGISTFGIGVVGFMAANLVPLMIIALMDGHGLSPTAAGTIMTACLLSSAASCLLTSRWTALSGRYVVARAGLLLAAAGFGAAALIPSTPVAIVGIILGGLGGGGAVSAGGAALAALRNPNRVSGISGLANRAVVTVVLALIPLFGTGMLSAFGFLACLSLAAFFSAGWLPVAEATPARDVPYAPETDGRPDVGRPPAASRRLTLAGFTLLACFALWALGEDSLWAVAGSMGTAQAGVGEQELGLVLSASTAGGLVAGAAMAYVGNRLGRTVPLAALLVLGGVLKLAAGFATDPTWYMVSVIAWNTVYAIAFMYVVAVASALDASGRWSAPLLGVYLIGSAFSPLFGTLIAETLGYVPLAVILAGFSFVLLVPFTVIARLSTRVEREASASGSQPEFNHAAIA
ncbi:MFS transporter [Arthrobacter sp. CJ23]|uniref:MFS transporter n=1 Tax=Arthrobacter sp. CJ23 TaxID=2972479 RepID=UPI00215C7BC6|nr:MFS transporter [Arthrobacter sp. CJ23]UVJ40231.1 MFS transporter [Arthrobacter sp. CJ23]